MCALKWVVHINTNVSSTLPYLFNETLWKYPESKIIIICMPYISMNTKCNQPLEILSASFLYHYRYAVMLQSFRLDAKPFHVSCNKFYLVNKIVDFVFLHKLQGKLFSSSSSILKDCISNSMGGVLYTIFLLYEKWCWSFIMMPWSITDISRMYLEGYFALCVFEVLI